MSQNRLLIVDDEEMGREVLSDLLAPEGYELNFAVDGNTALEAARADVPDLILLDVMLPGISGFEVCRTLRADPVLSEVPVLLVTALGDRKSRLKGIEAGADAFISKPFDRVELRAHVRSTIQLNRYRRLLTERTKFEWVIENARDGYVLLGGDGQIHYANQYARDYLHLSEQQLNNQKYYFIALAREHYQLEPSEIWREWPGLPVNSNTYLVRPENHQEHALWLQVDTLCLPTDTRSDLLVRLRDVSAEKSLQQQTWSFQALISHKLRTPLMGMQALQLVRRELGDGLPPRAGQFLRIAEENIERLEQQIQDILAFIDAPQRERRSHSSGFSLGLLPEMLATLNQEMNVKVQLDMPVSCSILRLSILRENIHSILQELIQNSIKFHPRQKPEITVALHYPGKHRVHLQVIDDGRHISPVELRKIWQPYYQSEKNITGEIQGTGLGLPTIASMLWSQGGHCHVRNRSDKPGIIIELQLPLFEPTE